MNVDLITVFPQHELRIMGDDLVSKDMLSFYYCCSSHGFNCSCSLINQTNHSENKLNVDDLFTLRSQTFQVLSIKKLTTDTSGRLNF